MFSLKKLCVLLLIGMWSGATCFTLTMEKRKKSKPLSARRKPSTKPEFLDDMAHQFDTLKLLAALKNELFESKIAVGLEDRFLIHYLLAIGNDEVADKLIACLSDREAFDAIASQIPFTKAIYDQAKELYEALSKDNYSLIESVILSGRAKPCLLSAIANEAVYDGKFAIAELLFRHNISFLTKRIGHINTASLLWFYQHGINMLAPLDQTTRLHSLINAAMENSKLVMRITITQSKPSGFERLIAILITIAFGRGNLTKQLLAAYTETYIDCSEMLIARAAAFGRIPIMQLLLKELSASPSALQQALEIAAHRSHFSMVRFLVKNYKKEIEASLGQAFKAAVAVNHIEMARYLASVLKQGEESGNIEMTKQTIFKEAAYEAGIHRNWQLFYWVVDQALSFEIPLTDLRSFCASVCNKKKIII